MKYGDIYGRFYSKTQLGIRRSAYVDDMGQNSWLRSREELRDWLAGAITEKSEVLDLGCGAGGPALALVELFGCSVTGVDADASGITTATAAAGPKRRRARFLRADLEATMPFEDASFDAVVSIDTVIHLRDRSRLFADIYRVLRNGGLFLFTDAGVMTGSLSQAELDARSMMAPVCLSKPGEIETHLVGAGLTLREAREVTEPLLTVARARLDYISSHEAEVVADMGHEWTNDQRRYLTNLKTVTEQGRLKRFLFTAMKTP